MSLPPEPTPPPPQRRRRLRRGAYLLPSLFTIGNMVLGFYAIVNAFRGSQVLLPELGDPYFARAALLRGGDRRSTGGSPG